MCVYRGINVYKRDRVKEGEGRGRGVGASGTPVSFDTPLVAFSLPARSLSVDKLHSFQILTVPHTRKLSHSSYLGTL